MDLSVGKLKKVLNLGMEIAQIKDIDLLLEKILSEARSLTNCDAGSIYRRDNGSLVFSYSQNDSMQRQLPPGKKLPFCSFSIPISNASLAGYVACSGKALNIADVDALDRSFPFSFDRSYDEATGYRTKSVFTIPLKNFRNDVIGVLQLLNAKDAWGNVIPFSGDEELLNYFANNAAHAIERAKLTRELIQRMNKMAEMRDPGETTPHVNRVASYAVVLYEAWARKAGIQQDELERERDLLRMSAMLHDVGKVAISDTILKKPGRLTPEEFDVMKGHTLFGANLFSDIHSPFDESAAVVALNHHERWDGNGYPGHVDPATLEPIASYETAQGRARGKKGEEIPLFGRIVALADVYDALSCRRCYKEAWEQDEVLKIIQEEAGKQFDPDLVRLFMESLDSIQQVREQYPDNH